MNISITAEAKVFNVKVTDKDLIVSLVDGREVKVPLAWYPRLAMAKPAERKRFRLVGGGIGIHWLDLDEDLSVAGILAVR